MNYLNPRLATEQLKLLFSYSILFSQWSKLHELMPVCVGSSKELDHTCNARLRTYCGLRL